MKIAGFSSGQPVVAPQSATGLAAHFAAFIASSIAARKGIDFVPADQPVVSAVVPIARDPAGMARQTATETDASIQFPRDLPGKPRRTAWEV
jgi:CTP:molybdopterin cytidylyltransferase MocA